MTDNSKTKIKEYQFSLVRLRPECKVQPTFVDFEPLYGYCFFYLEELHHPEVSFQPSIVTAVTSHLHSYYQPIRYIHMIYRKPIQETPKPRSSYLSIEFARASLIQTNRYFFRYLRKLKTTLPHQTTVKFARNTSKITINTWSRRHTFSDGIIMNLIMTSISCAFS